MKLTEEQKKKMRAGKRVSYKALIRAKCFDCLNVLGNDCGTGWNCEMGEEHTDNFCPLYPAQPWKSIAMPQKLR